MYTAGVFIVGRPFGYENAWLGVTLLLNVLSVIFIVAFGIVNIVSCGLLGCVRNSIYENTKKSIMDNVDPKRPDANRFTTVEY